MPIPKESEGPLSDFVAQRRVRLLWAIAVKEGFWEEATCRGP